MVSQALEEREEEFSNIVVDAFRFLESDYRFECRGLELKDLEYPQDARASVPYVGETVGIDVVLGFGDSSISVVFYELDRGSRPGRLSFYPGDEGAKAARLETVVRVLGGSDVSLPLPEITPSLSVAEMCRRGEERSKRLREDLRDVVFSLADLVREHAQQILKGDTSRFTEFQTYHSEFWGWT